MDQERVEQIKKEILEIENEMNFYHNKYPLYPRILIMGLTGSGKSCIISCLLNKKVTIAKDESMFIRLEGEGICNGSKIHHKSKMIFVDEKNELILINIPSLEDFDGIEKEIINAFIKYYILKSVQHELKIKILLAVSACEFMDRRGRFVLESIRRMVKIFPNLKEIKNTIGLIITKGDVDDTGEYYLSNLQKTNYRELKEWLDYFYSYANEQVFSFPLALKENVGKQYVFSDYDRVMNFILNDYLINPKIKVSVSDEACNTLKLINCENSRSMEQIFEELYQIFDEQYKQISTLEAYSDWLANIHLLIDKNINSISDFLVVIQRIIPNSLQYEHIFSKLNECDILNSFINDLCAKIEIPHLKNFIITLAKAVVKQESIDFQQIKSEDNYLFPY